MTDIEKNLADVREKIERAADAVTPGNEVWAELEALRQEIGQSWQSEKTAVELISEQRR